MPLPMNFEEWGIEGVMGGRSRAGTQPEVVDSMSKSFHQNHPLDDQRPHGYELNRDIQ